MVDNGLGLTFIPSMAIEAGILEGTQVDARPLRSNHSFRRIALIWRRSSPREVEFQLLATALRRIMRELIPELEAIDPAQARTAEPQPA
jgi:LysR family hydrogen peroxide-inducible transcriptional activator